MNTGINSGSPEGFSLPAVSSTPDGVLVGIDPTPARETAPEAEAQFTTLSPRESDARYTEEDLRKAREQEKSKLYNRLDKMAEELSTLKQERESRIAEERSLTEKADAEAKRRAEDEMDVRQLLEQKEREFQSQLESLRREQEHDRALLEKERTFAELTAYRAARIEEERETIIPELIDLVQGGTVEEIEQSIAGLQERSSRIIDSAQQAMTSTRREMTGTRVTVPPAGPLDGTSEQRPFTPEDLRSMSMSDYAKHRARLLGNEQGRNRGLFG